MSGERKTGPRRTDSLKVLSTTSRRDFLRTASTGLAVAGIGACGRPPDEKILPYNEVPPELTPGVAQYYATSLLHEGHATGVIVQSREGRPIKIEGNPAHPASLGATGVFDQAKIYELYDARRARQLRERGQPREWSQLAAAALPRTDDGDGLRFLLPPTSSPLTGALLQRILAGFPRAKFTFYSPADPGGMAEVSQRLWGRPLATHYDFGAARRILSLDTDVLGMGPFHLRYSRMFADQRRVESRRGTMNRLYAVGPRPNVTTSLADWELSCPGHAVGLVAGAILGELVRDSSIAASTELRQAARDLEVPAAYRRFAVEAATDLLAHRGSAVVVASERQPWSVHAIAAAMNELLGAVGRTVWWTEPALIGAGRAEQSLVELVEEMRSEQVQTLLVGGLDMVHCAPPELNFLDALRSVPDSIAWTLYPDATARAARWMVSAAHDLEGWGDARAYDGTLSLRQPMIEPLWGGRTLDEVLGLWAGLPLQSGHELLQSFYAASWGQGWEARLERALKFGLVADTELERVEADVPWDQVVGALRDVAQAGPPVGLEIGIHLDPKLFDGRFAPNAWLQELPHPITKQTWGNAALVGPKTAASHGWAAEEVIEIRVGDHSVEAPVFIVPGHAEGSMSVALGYGQPGNTYRDFYTPGPADPPDEPIGFDAYRLRTLRQPWYRTGAKARSTGARARLAITQNHQDEHERELAIVHTLEALHERGDELVAQLRGSTKHLWLVDQNVGSPQWGMVIDMTVCHGCSACVVACQAENNIPTVGFQEVRRGREMHWLRIDRYVEGPLEHLRVVNQPMLCQHCEYAPCEYVCPVNATVHSPDGLNEMIYNRCVGTRFCSNNCPYYVRRFNWFAYEPDHHALMALQKNPEVTVRERGVMEKCTYCVQRIRRGQIHADLENRELAEGEIVTACQQACPTRAIMFGDISDPDSEVSRWRNRPHRYSVLHDLGTEPRTVYLVKLRNLGPQAG